MPHSCSDNITLSANALLNCLVNYFAFLDAADTVNPSSTKPSSPYCNLNDNLLVAFTHKTHYNAADSLSVDTTCASS